MEINRVSHFEISSPDPERAMNFFGKVFGWEFEKFDNNNYWFVITGKDGQGINGGLTKKEDADQPVINSVIVQSIDETLSRIVTEGGEVVLPKTEIESHGWLAYFKDPDGITHSLWQNK